MIPEQRQPAAASRGEATVASAEVTHNIGLQLPEGFDSINMARAVLGTVPVEADGGAHFTAPSGAGHDWLSPRFYKTLPGTFGACASLLYVHLKKGHKGVALSSHPVLLPLFQQKRTDFAYPSRFTSRADPDDAGAVPRRSRPCPRNASRPA